MKNRTPDYRKWIEAGYREYGEDPWFFIRELAQNSRDAGASSIHIEVKRTSSQEELLVFEDNGSGMSYDHAVGYLFRLYASSKGKDKNAAGMFGIGFWTVLKFNPIRLIIESNHKGKSWGIEVESASELNTKSVSGSLKTRGTRITLIRNASERSLSEFQQKVRTSIVQYCSYLRRRSHRAEPLPVYFMGENLTKEMKFTGPVSINFKTSSVEGAVGLGPRPKVKLFACGLPVWEGNELEELSHTPPSHVRIKKKQPDWLMGEGLSPIFLLNGSNLDVNISRKRVIDNRKLQVVRRTAETELARMVESVVDYVAPRTFFQRFSDRIKRSTHPVFRYFPKILLFTLLIILPLEYFLIRTFYSGNTRQSSESVMSFKVDTPYYSGASISNARSASQPKLSYSPPIDTWLRLFSAEEYEIDSGFLQNTIEKKQAVSPQLSLSGQSLMIIINLQEKGRLFLPQPLGYIVDPGSVFHDGKKIELLQYSSSGEVVVSIPDNGKLIYKCYPMVWETIFPITPQRLKKLSQLPNHFVLPGTLKEILTAYAGFGIDKRVEIALKLTADLLVYDDSQKTVQRYAKWTGEPDWFKKVISIGAGDCDVINGVTVLLLRRMEVPARLVIGLVGKKGGVLPQLHAWTEYYKDGNWYIVDATEFTQGVSHPDSVSSLPEDVISAQSKTVPSQEPPAENSKIVERYKWPFKLILNFAALILIILLLFFFGLIIKFRVPKRSFHKGEFRQMEEDLAGMLLNELLHPGVWGRNGGIRDYKLLPTINSNIGPISLQHALKLGSKGCLFSCNTQSFNGNDYMVSYLKKASVPILDSGNPAFAPIIKILPGALYIDQVFDLRVVIPDESAIDSLSQLLHIVNKRLKKINNSIPPIVFAPGSNLGEILDIDLSLLPSFESWGIPKRFIVINPESSTMQNLVDLFKNNPELAQFRLIQTVLKETGMMPMPIEVIIESVSKQLLNFSGRLETL